MVSDLKNLGRMIEIIVDHGHAIKTSTTKAIGSAGPNVSFGCDQGGAFVSVCGGPRMALDDAKNLVADLFNAITYAHWREWLCDHGMAIREDAKK